MKTRNTESTTALERFIETTHAIAAVLEKIEDANNVDFGFDLDAIHWGHVGTAEHVLTCLREVLADINDARRS